MCAMWSSSYIFKQRENEKKKKHPHTTEWYTQNDSWREMVCIAAWKNICALFNSNNAWIHTLCKYLYNQGKWKNLDCSGLFRSAITYLFVHNIKSDTKLPPVNWDEWLSWVINTDGTKKRWCYFDAVFLQTDWQIVLKKLVVGTWSQIQFGITDVSYCLQSFDVSLSENVSESCSLM